MLLLLAVLQKADETEYGKLRIKATEGTELIGMFWNFCLSEGRQNTDCADQCV